MPVTPKLIFVMKKKLAWLDLQPFEQLQPVVPQMPPPSAAASVQVVHRCSYLSHTPVPQEAVQKLGLRHRQHASPTAACWVSIGGATAAVAAPHYPATNQACARDCVLYSADVCLYPLCVKIPGRRWRIRAQNIRHVLCGSHVTKSL